MAGGGTTVLELDGRTLRLADVERVARSAGAEVQLASSAREAMLRARKQVDAIVDSGEPAYGVNTGFGHFSEVSVSADQVRELQLNLVRSHAVGTGEALPAETVRALLLLRANVMARGASGVRPAVADQMLGLLRADVLPVVPRQGSVGGVR